MAFLYIYVPWLIKWLIGVKSINVKTLYSQSDVVQFHSQKMKKLHENMHLCPQASTQGLVERK